MTDLAGREASLGDSAFDALVRRISEQDAKLGETIRRVEAGWETGDPADRRITERVSRALLSSIDDGYFSVRTMVDGFTAFSHEFLDNQMEALRSGSYKAKDYGAVRREVYENAEFMASTYYPALMLSYLASPNYRWILRSFDLVLERWKNLPVRQVIDIASGHGLLLLFALERLEHARGTAVDLSKVAGDVCRSLQKSTGWAQGRVDCMTLDLTQRAPDSLVGAFDAAICCELLEHLPNPGEFLAQARHYLAPNARLFVSAAVRMESVDHLTYFAQTSDVRQLLVAAGFDVLHEMSVPFATSRPGSRDKWMRMLADPLTAATYVAECVMTGAALR